MCGIFGYTGFKNEGLEEARRSLNTLSHRGPDQWGDWYDENIYIGHRRLSIIDLSENARQPMMYGDVVITVNGEIYNFLEIKKHLQKKYQFRSTSDSEIILHGYIEWGIDKLLEKIDGMYAICIYDRRKKTLYLARDRVGIKPLYYSELNGTYVWSSELKAIERHYHKNTLDIDKTASYDFLTYLYIPSPKTHFKNVYKLEPAHYLEINLHSRTTKKKRYWQLTPKNKSISLQEASTSLRTLINKSVKEQLVSDVPIGFFLSGGLDSSAVVAGAVENSDNVNTYTIGFGNKKLDETQYAEIVSKHFKTFHKTKTLELPNIIDMLPKLKDWYDEPFADTSAFPTYLVSKFSRECSKVVLTGDGGDEVFGGYSWYFTFKYLKEHQVPVFPVCKSTISYIKRRYRNLLFGKAANRIENYLLLDDFELYAKLMGGLLKHEKKEYAKQLEIPEDYDDYWHFRRFYRRDLPILTRLQFLDFHTYLPDDILTKVDRVSMAVSLEARVPLLSKEIIEYTFSLPESLIFYGKRLKGLMKFAYRDILPQEILYREKRGFNVPDNTLNRVFPGNVLKQEAILRILFR